MHKTAIIPDAVKGTAVPLTPGIRSGELLFVSGQASVDAMGAIVSGTFEEEMRRSMDNLRLVLEAAGCGFDDVVQVRAYLGDAGDAELYNRLYREYFAEPLPARTTLANCIGALRFEIDAVARVPSG